MESVDAYFKLTAFTYAPSRHHVHNTTLKLGKIAFPHVEELLQGTMDFSPEGLVTQMGYVGLSAYALMVL